jgi:hypothetical protein
VLVACRQRAGAGRRGQRGPTQQAHKRQRAPSSSAALRQRAGAASAGGGRALREQLAAVAALPPGDCAETGGRVA